MFKRKQPKPAPIQLTDERIRAKAYELWKTRSDRASPEDDWNNAKQLLEKELSVKQIKGVRKTLAWLNQPFVWTERNIIEPTASWFDKADVFRIVEKVSPVMEAIGVILIPVAIWWFTQSDAKQKDEQEKARRSQESVKTYLNQLTTTFLDGDLSKQAELRQQQYQLLHCQPQPCQPLSCRPQWCRPQWCQILWCRPHQCQPLQCRPQSCHHQ